MCFVQFLSIIVKCEFFTVQYEWRYSWYWEHVFSYYWPRQTDRQTGRLFITPLIIIRYSYCNIFHPITHKVYRASDQGAKGETSLLYRRAKMPRVQATYTMWRGGGPPLAELAIAPKRIYILIWNFLTFLLYQKPKFEEEKKSVFFTPPPLGGWY